MMVFHIIIITMGGGYWVCGCVVTVTQQLGNKAGNNNNNV